MGDDENTGVETQDRDDDLQAPDGDADAQDAEAKAADPEAEELSDEEKLLARLQEAIEVAVEEIGPLRRKLDISIPREFIDDQMGEQFDELRRDADIPGFRRGRAPIRLVQKRFGHDVGEQITARLLSNGYLAASKKLELRTLGDPQVWASVREKVTDDSGMNKVVVSEKLVDVETALEHITMPKEGSFTYSCEVDLRPEFELPSLDKISVVKKLRTVGAEDVSAEIDRLLAMTGRYVPVESGPVAADDLLVGHLKLTVADDVAHSEANAMLAARDQRYAGVDLVGFGAAAVGKQAGQTVTLDTTLPDDYRQEESRGKAATFSFEIADVKRLEKPELTPEWLAAAGYENEAELRESIHASLERRLAEQVAESMRRQIADYLLEHTDFELPESLSRRQTDVIVQRRRVEMYQAGVPEAEIEKVADELRVRAAQEAASDLKLFFVMDRIATERGVEVSESEMNGAISAIAARRGKRFDRMRDELHENDSMTALYLRLRDAKTLDALLETAEVREE